MIQAVQYIDAKGCGKKTKIISILHIIQYYILNIINMKDLVI
jgi:hypothetical protein